MTFWRVREELSKADRLRRSYYELLRDELDHFLLKHALIDSYFNFMQNGTDYPFVEKRELKPRARIPGGCPHSIELLWGYLAMNHPKGALPVRLQEYQSSGSK